MPDEPEQPQEPQKPKKPKQELPTDSTDLVPSQTVKLGSLTVEVTPQGLERFLVDNDASQLAGNAATRALYYLEMCRRYDVDPFTQPFDWIPGADGKGLTLYPNKEFAAQRRKKSGTSCRVVEEGVRGPANGQPGPEVYFVRMQGEITTQPVPVEQLVGFLSASPSREELVRWGQSLVEMARKTTGRVDEEIGVVPFTDSMGRPIDPMSKANAMKRAYTQAKRRVTLSLEGCGADDASRERGDYERDQGPSQPRVITPPTRVKPQKAELPAAQETPAPVVAVPVATPVVPVVVVQQQQQQQQPVVVHHTQPGPPAPPTPAPSVTVVGKRAVYIPKR